MSGFSQSLVIELDAIRAQSLRKSEREIISSQSLHIEVSGRRDVLNFGANICLGLANYPALIKAAKAAHDSYGFSMASVRIICGTTDLHRQRRKIMTHRMKAADFAQGFALKKQVRCGKVVLDWV